ncbi:MAG: hypothetical protein AB1705_09510 [Verrucomicrobiota bacterium]
MIKFFFRWGFRVLILLIVLAAVGVLLKDTLAKSAAEARLRALTGLDVRIGNLEIGLFSPIVRVENCRFNNTPEFGGSPFLHIEELYVEYDRSALFYRELNLKLLRFNLAEANVVRNKQGLTNVQAIRKHMAQARAGKTGNGSAGNGNGEEEFKFLGIGTLNLTLRKFREVDLARPERTHEIDLNMKNQVFTNLKTGEDVKTNVVPVLMRYGVEALFAETGPTNGAPPKVSGAHTKK